MGRAWKPGDVAAVSFDGKTEHVAIRTLYFHGEYVEEGRWHGGRAGALHGPEMTARPLVVIDPEDREQVERLAEAILYAATVAGLDHVSYRGTSGDERLGVLVEAVRSLVANPPPPKPDEPTGIGAVVEDEDGVLWMNYPGMFALPWSAPGQPSCKWSELGFVKVLSEGVTA